MDCPFHSHLHSNYLLSIKSTNNPLQDDNAEHKYRNQGGACTQNRVCTHRYIAMRLDVVHPEVGNSPSSP